jgi:hypothetical protein
MVNSDVDLNGRARGELEEEAAEGEGDVVLTASASAINSGGKKSLRRPLALSKPQLGLK